MRTIMNLLIVGGLFLACFCVSVVHADCTGSSPTWTTTPDYVSLSSCVSQATYGDTINVSAGAAQTYTSTLNITKNIKLAGPGASNLTILSGGGTTIILNYTPDSTTITNGGVFELSGFTFDGNGGSSTNYWGLVVLNAPTPTSGGVTPSWIKIHDNRFQNNGPSESMALACVGGLTAGVIYNNSFLNIGNMLKVMGDWGGSYCGGYYTWKYDPTFSYASPATLYFEDNSVSYSSSYVAAGSNTGWIETGWGARLVVRYNTWDPTNHTTMDYYWDDHGEQWNQTSCTGQCSSQVVEYYGNIINNAKGGQWHNIRGSWAMVFNNLAVGTASPGIDLYGMSGGADCDSDACGSSSGPLAGTVQQLNNTYAFNNQFSGTQVRLVNGGGIPNCTPAIAENVSYFQYNSSCTAGTCSAGVGVGPSAPTGACTTGVGYWVWNQGATLPTTVADMRTYTQAGIFYKCTSTNTWTEYFKPYKYPHPLRGTTPLSPPGNLRVVPNQ